MKDQKILLDVDAADPSLFRIADSPGKQSASGAHPAAFTLIELLVVIAIISLLSGAMLPALARAKVGARQTRELAAARQLMTAYTAYATDNRDAVMPGYATSAMCSPNPAPGVASLSVFDDAGEAVYGVRAQRYPWRVAPYLGENLYALYNDPKLLERYRERADFQYVVSLSPSFGLNAEFVGGKASPGFGFNSAALRTWGPFYITRMDQAHRPSSLIAFGSARGVDPDGGVPVAGFYMVDSPYLQGSRWTANESEAAEAPELLGNVDARFFGQATIGTLDSHVAACRLDALRDMRLWSNLADRPDWVLRAR